MTRPIVSREIDAPERHGGQRREQQELEDTDERNNDTVFIHRGTLGVTGDGVDPAGRPSAHPIQAAAPGDRVGISCLRKPNRENPHCRSAA